MIPKSEPRSRKTSCSRKKIERDDEPKKSDPALAIALAQLQDPVAPVPGAHLLIDLRPGRREKILHEILIVSAVEGLDPGRRDLVAGQQHVRGDVAVPLEDEADVLQISERAGELLGR